MDLKFMRLTPGIEVFDQTALFTSLFYKVIQRSEQQRLNVSAGSYNMKFFFVRKISSFRKVLVKINKDFGFVLQMVQLGD